MVHIKFGENRDPFCSFFKELKADFFFKKHEKLKKLKINGTQGRNAERAGVPNSGGTAWRVKKCACEFG